MLQKDTRELCHMHWDMMSINPHTKLSEIKARKIQVNRTSGKMYMKYLKFDYNGKKYKLKKLNMNLPPENIIKDYETAKMKFTSNLNKKIIESSKPKQKPLTEKQQQCYEMLRIGKDMKEIAVIMGVCLVSAYEYRKAILKKGYSLEK